MKGVFLAYLSSILLPGLIQACCEPSTDALARKWEVWKHPFLRKRALEITQKRLLSILGLEDYPVPGRHVIPHSFMLETFKKLSGGKNKGAQQNLEAVRTVTGMVDQARDDNSVSPTSQQIFYFNISKLPSSQHIIAANLRVLRLPTALDKAYLERHGATYRVKLYGKSSVLQPSLTPFESSNFELLDSITFDITDSKEKWNVFSVKKAVEKWHKAKGKFHLLELRVESVLSGKPVRPEEVGFSKAGRLHNKHALLVVYSSDSEPSQSYRKPESPNKNYASNAISQSKNSDLERDENSTEMERNRVRRDLQSKAGTIGSKKTRRGAKSKRRRKKDSCRRKPLYVDFNQLGWSNWVIAPKGYSAFFCQGLCEFPIDNHLKPSNHATVQTILNSVAPSLAPQACCTPNKLSAISILFIDTNDNIVYKKYEDMVVERCGCS